MAHKKFNKKVISEYEWRYEAWFPEDVDYYIIENVPEGYMVHYENVGVHVAETDRCYNGGTIINYRVPKTGDEAPLVLWIAFVLVGTAILGGIIFYSRRKADI
ncbi:MAG: LPXTG cell wall anchor domain-containing protein [Clostridia bacterium]|nr:LPXTG cell wall anchor domain-containing protein [Clostridia bacterium]